MRIIATLRRIAALFGPPPPQERDPLPPPPPKDGEPWTIKTPGKGP